MSPAAGEDGSANSADQGNVASFLAQAQLAPYQACLNLLRVALGEGEGFIKISGEVGTGKTLLCRTLLNELDDAYFQVAYLPHPGMSPVGLRQALARELHIDRLDEMDTQAVFDALHQRLIQLAIAGKSTVVPIDEAQALPPETLEALRLLTNLETERSKLLQVVLFGQAELDAILEHNEFRQLRQRITFSYRLRPLDVRDTQRYLNERLVRGSGGIPRLLSILAHKALMAAYGEGTRQDDRWLGWCGLAATLSALLVIGAWPWLGQWRELLP